MRIIYFACSLYYTPEAYECVSQLYSFTVAAIVIKHTLIPQNIQMWEDSDGKQDENLDCTKVCDAWRFAWTSLTFGLIGEDMFTPLADSSIPVYFSTTEYRVTFYANCSFGHWNISSDCQQQHVNTDDYTTWFRQPHRLLGLQGQHELKHRSENVNTCFTDQNCKLTRSSIAHRTRLPGNCQQIRDILDETTELVLLLFLAHWFSYYLINFSTQISRFAKQ